MAIDVADAAAPVEAPPGSTPADERPRGRSRIADRAGSRGCSRQRPLHWLIALVVIAVAVGGVLRFITSAHIWLDEALTVEISSRHLPQLFTALRHDGSPPLYYLMLHFWMDVFGRSDVAIRALSGVLSLRLASAGVVRRPPGRAGRRVVRPHRAARRRPHRHRRAAAVRDLAVHDPLRHRGPHVLAGRLPGAALRARAGPCSRAAEPAALVVGDADDGCARVHALLDVPDAGERRVLPAAAGPQAPALPQALPAGAVRDARRERALPAMGADLRVPDAAHRHPLGAAGACRGAARHGLLVGGSGLRRGAAGSRCCC